MSQVSPGLDEMYDMATAEPLFAELDKLKVAKWYKDGAEQANLLNQEEADAAMSYSSDAYTFLTQSPDEYVVGSRRKAYRLGPTGTSRCAAPSTTTWPTCS